MWNKEEEKLAVDTVVAVRSILANKNITIGQTNSSPKYPVLTCLLGSWSSSINGTCVINGSVCALCRAGIIRCVINGSVCAL